MGVTNLWQIISPVQQHCPLSSLHGQTLAVDLSIWVVEGQGVRQMQGVVTKPHLRNLFFRISHLLQIGVHPLFVIEGNAPELKQEVMARRQQVRYQNHRQGPRGGRTNSRRNFNSCLRECCELLDLVGVPYVQSQGEAEAMCAALNAAGMVDGCITNDGDAFLYGARKVYRNFTLNSKDPHVECYSMDDIEEKLSLDRSKLIAMALLLGCDYLPKGVPGVGMDKAMKLMKVYSDSGVNALHRFAAWKRMDEGGLLHQIEVVVYRKARSVADFPQSKVISEFLEVKDKCPKKIQLWKRPQLNSLQDYALRKLEWPEEYTEEKILPLLTLWDLLDIKRGNALAQHLVPHRLVKKRLRQGKAYFEIQWYKQCTETKPQQKPADGDTEQFYTTLEEQGLFTSCFPEMVHAFELDENKKNEKKKKPAGKRKQKKRMDKENQNLEDLDPVGRVTNKLTELNVKDKSESRSLKTVCESKSSETERRISQSETYDTIDLTACDTDKGLVYITETSGTTSCLLTSDIEYKCTGENYYHDDIDDDDILMSVLGPSNVGTESAESLNATKDCAGKVGNDYRYTEVAEVDSESDQEYIPLSQRLQQRMKTNSSNSRKSIVHRSTLQSVNTNTNLMRSSSLSSKSNGKSVSNVEGICVKKEVPTTEYSKVKERKAKMDQKSTYDKENVTNTDVSSHQRHCDNNAGVLKLSQTSAFSPTKYETEKISANVRRPFQHVQERTLSSSPNSVVFSPFSGLDATKVTDFTHIARMNFTSVSTPKLEGLSQSDQSNRSGFGKLPDIELNLTGHLPSSCQKEYIGSSKDRTKSLSAHDLKCINLKESAYIDSHRQRHLPSANRLNISPFTPASVDKSLLSSRLKKSVNQSMNSTRSVGSSFALEYGNFNISASLLQNFSQHSVLLSLMADENSVYGSPFVPSECSVNMNSSTGASPFFSNISTKSSLGVSATVDDFSSPSQPNVGHPHASPKFGSSDVCKLSFCSDSASRSATQKTVTQSQIHELSSLVQDLSFSETAVPKEGPIQTDASTLSLTNSQHEDESVRASVISLARKIVDGSTLSGSKLEVTVNDSKYEESHHAYRMCDNEESPVNLLDRLKSRLNTGLLQDFVKQRKVSVKPIRD